MELQQAVKKAAEAAGYETQGSEHHHEDGGPRRLF